MSKNQRQKKEKCQHTIISNIKNSKYTFCENCGGIIMKENSKLYYTIKPKSMEKKLNEDPIKIFETMSKRSPITIDYHSIQNSHLKKRKCVMANLQKLSIKMKYSDSTFYKALNYLDNTMRKIVDINSKQILYLTVGFFIISGKYNENDIFEPDLNDLIQFNEKHILQVEEILRYEIICLQLIDYDLINYSTYDWLMILFSNGFIFEEEIKNLPFNSINNLYNYIKKTLALITSKPLFIKYNPFKIAFSLIQIGREEFIHEEEGKYFNFIKDLYKIKFSDYENCYKDIKTEIINSKNKHSMNIIDDKLNSDLKNSSSNQLITINKEFIPNLETKNFERENIPLFFKNNEDDNINPNINEDKENFKRGKSKTKTVKIDCKIDFLNKDDDSKSKNDFVNDINKISSKGTFSENHVVIRRLTKLSGTVLVNEEEGKIISNTIKENMKENQNSESDKNDNLF